MIETSGKPDRKKRGKHHKKRRKRRRRFVIVNPLRLILSLAILVMIIVICCQLCNRRGKNSNGVQTVEPVAMTSNELHDSVAALADRHAKTFRSLAPDTAAMADYLLETRARATDFRNRFGAEAEQIYVSTFEKESGILQLQ